ncbi:NAD(P)-dependent oxidoreductase, partial [Achromobacter sp. GG226]|uniref:NAD(P)-binding domain-containing protein n=1 Tax=Verticiella alkaliphila TaxID=2779529 RepID=UPI001C0B2450
MIGFIGLGDMGLPMARRLLDTGHAVMVWNRTASRADVLAAETSAQVADTPAALARACDVIGLCLSSHVTVQALCEGEDGLFAHAAAAGRRPVYVDFSTGSPEAAQALADAAARHGGQWVARARERRP